MTQILTIPAEQAERLLNDCGTTLTVTYLCHGKHFDSDTSAKDIYSFVLTPPGGTYSGKFRDLIHN